MPFTLNSDQIEHVLQDEKRRRMLNDDETAKVASFINDKIDIPFLDESSEQVVFFKIVRRLDEVLYQFLPNEVYGFFNTPQNGIDDTEAANLKLRLSKLIIEKIRFPFLSELLEGKVIGLFIDVIVNAMKKGMSL